MSKDTFRILKEINSLYTANQKLDELIASENTRISKIENLRLEKENLIVESQIKLKETNALLAQAENSIAENQSKLNQAMSNKNNVYTESEINALENQISRLKEGLDVLEDQGLELLGQVEEVSQHINDATSFLSGSLETLETIKAEVNENNSPNLEKIKGHNQRIENLFLDIPDDLKLKFEKLMARNMKYGPTAQIDKNCCSVCRMEIPRLDVEKVEKHLQIKFCQTCDRLFIPISSLFK